MGPSLARICACVFAFCAIAVLPQCAAEHGGKPVMKPLLVLIFDKNCKAWCSQVRPVVADLQKSYIDDVEFAEIDVTPGVLPEAKKKAKELGIGNLLEDTIGQVPLVLICASARSKDYNEIVGPKSKEIYEDYLKKVLSKRAK